MKKNITLIPAPANDHRAVGLVERLISTIKQHLACIKEANKELNSFTIKAALKSILYQLRICKHRTTKLSPFESHFERKANTPLSNISTQPRHSDLSYDKTLNHYIDEETVTPNELLTEEHWGNYRSDRWDRKEHVQGCKRRFHSRATCQWQWIPFLERNKSTSSNTPQGTRSANQYCWEEEPS